MVRKSIPWLAATLLAAAVVFTAVQRPVEAQGTAFPLFFLGSAGGADLENSTVHFATVGTRSKTIYGRLLLQRAGMVSILSGKATTRTNTFRLPVKSVFGSRNSGTMNGTLGDAITGPYSVTNFAPGNFDTFVLAPNTAANARLQGTWMSNPAGTKDRFTLTIRRSTLSVKGRSARFGTFDLSGSFSTWVNRDPDDITIISLLPTRVKIPAGVTPTEFVQTPNVAFGVLLPNTGEMQIILGRDSDGVDIRTNLVQR